MPVRGRLTATATSAIALLALTGCERPAPIVTVTSGGDSVHKAADVYCFEEQSGDECAERAEGVTTLEVSPGQQVGVDVDKDVAERGWYIELAARDGQGQPQRSDVQDDHYFAFTLQGIGEEGLVLSVKALPEEGSEDEESGLWTFELQPS